MSLSTRAADRADDDAQPASGEAAPTVGQRRLTHLRPLDGLRGIAVLAVVVYHFSPDIAPGGFLGVDIFFVLSGFLITSLLVNERERTHTISLVRFWVRRARRLLPALVLVLLVVGVVTLFLSDRAEGHRIGLDGLAAFGYFANWRFIWSGQSYVEQILQTTPSPLRHTWSLAIEEQFYLAWPLIVAAVGAIIAKVTRRSRRDDARFRTALVGVCLVLGAASFLRMDTLFRSSGDANRVYYGTDSHAWLLLLGAALAALSAGAPTLAKRAPRVALVAAGCAASVALVVIMANLEATSPDLYRGDYLGIGLLIVIVLAAAAQPGPNPLGRMFSIRPLVGLGLISYGVYLWHWPAVVWLTPERTGLDGAALFALRSAFTLVVSLASYHFVEQPIRTGKAMAKWTSSTSFAALGVTSAMVIVLLVPVVFFPSVEAVPRVAPSAVSAPSTDAYANGPRCDSSASALEKLPVGSRPKIQLFGNSVAVEIRRCLAMLVRARGATFTSVVHSGRAPCVLLDRLRKQVENPATRPDVAIFSAAMIHEETMCPGGTVDWLVQTREAIDIWTRAGTKVYMVPTVPNAIGTEKNETDLYLFPSQQGPFAALAALDPLRVSVIDGGLFVRDALGAYQWRMPCLPGGEPGCGADGTVGVRWVDGFHFCTITDWDGHTCPPVHGGGERRVGTAVARQITELALDATASPPPPA